MAETLGSMDSLCEYCTCSYKDWYYANPKPPCSKSFSGRHSFQWATGPNALPAEADRVNYKEQSSKYKRLFEELSIAAETLNGIKAGIPPNALHEQSLVEVMQNGITQTAKFAKLLSE